MYAMGKGRRSQPIVGSHRGSNVNGITGNRIQHSLRIAEILGNAVFFCNSCSHFFHLIHHRNDLIFGILEQSGNGSAVSDAAGTDDRPTNCLHC